MKATINNETKEQRASYMLAYVILPPSILDYYELVDVQEKEDKMKRDPQETLWSDTTIHIYLDEKDNRTDEMRETLRPNGFTEESVVQDFPLRDRKVYLHIRRRRWLSEEGHNVILNVYPIMAEGTRLSDEFAAFLKGEDGYITGERADYWDILPRGW